MGAGPTAGAGLTADARKSAPEPSRARGARTQLPEPAAAFAAQRLSALAFATFAFVCTVAP